MAEKITVYQCPACTGPLKFDGTIGKLKCEYCGSTYTTQEIEALYKDKNESAAAADAEAQAKADKAEQAARKEAAESGDAGAASGWGSDAAHMRAYNCTTCGAELLCDETTAATSCPYCGNPTVIPGKFAGVDRPDYVIPFKVDKKQAVNSFKEYYKGRLLLPRSFASDNHIEEIKGVYVPFWMFSGEIDGRAQYEAYKEDKRRVGDEEITRREHYDVFREGSMRPFGMEYMPGYMANKYDVSKEQSRKRADERAVSSFRTALRNSVKNYNGVDVRQQSEKINPEKAEYGMLPVWLLSSNWQGQTYLFAMNGQSGKMIGDLPVSKPKLFGTVAALFAAVFAIMHFLILKQQGDSMLISAAVAFIVAAITGAVMNGSMKPVAKSTSAGAYVAPGGALQLRRHEDRFIRTTETRRKIESKQGGGSGGPGSGGPGSGGPGGPGSGGRPGGPGSGGRPGGPRR